MAADVFEFVRSVGGLLPADLLERVQAMDRDLPDMSAEGYGLAPGRRTREALGEEIAEAWSRAREFWSRYRETLGESGDSSTGTRETRDLWLLPLLGLLGYEDVRSAGAQVAGESQYPVSHAWHAVPMHLLSSRLELDRRTEGVRGAARQAPHSMVQELLNRSDDHLWAIVSNGHVLRLLRDNASLTREAFVEFDLQGMMDGHGYPSFALLWLTLHRTRLAAVRPGDCVLEQWLQTAQREGTRALDQLRDGVEAALETLGTGLLAHPDNVALRTALETEELTRSDLYGELLRIIYRLLFLFVTEDRGLLLQPEGIVKPDARERYLQYYSTARLRELARRRTGTRHDDLWRVLQIVMRSLGSARGNEALALPSLGGLLWDPERTSHVAGPEEGGTRLRNDHLLEAVRHLAFVARGRGFRRVDYRHLGSEELGSIYESLLELHPDVSLADRRFALVAGAGNERKTTGSYYTPTSLIKQLLDTSLEPLLERAEAADDPEEALLSLTVCDPACGSGHFLVAAAARIAARLAAHYEQRQDPDDPKRQDPRNEAMRDVVSHCIYGVDMNPMATELAKVSLWLEAHVPGKPLTFLDHHLKTGNSLLGTTPALIARGVPDEAFAPLLGDDPATCRSYRDRNRKLREGQRSLLAAESAEGYLAVAQQAAAITELADDTAAELEEKAKAHSRLEEHTELSRQRLTADAWCASFTAAKKASDKAQQPYQLFYELRDDQAPAASAAYEKVDAEHRNFLFFHWHVAFPHLFTASPDEQREDRAGWVGGFSLMIGNPPWERVKIQEKEWFDVREPDIANAPNKAARDRLIRALYEAEDGSPERRLATDWDAAQREAQATSHFMRSSGRYPLGGVGDVNTYAVFADLFRQTITTRGRVGIICPAGLAVGATYQEFFGTLVRTRTLHSFFVFENEDRLFADVHNQFKFGLMTLTGPEDPVGEMAFTGYIRQASDIGNPSRTYTLRAEDVATMNPNTLTAPIFRNARDALVTAKIHRNARVLVRDNDPAGNPWGVDFLRMFDMANDSHLFVTRDSAVEQGGERDGAAFRLPDGSRLLPLYEGKMIWPYDHRYGTYEHQTHKQANKGVLPHVTDEQHAGPNFNIVHRYWVPERFVTENLVHRWDRPWMLGWRRMGSSERTLLTGLTPTAAFGDSYFLLMPRTTPRAAAHLYASLASLASDYSVRQKGPSQLSQFIIKQVAVAMPPTEQDRCPWRTDALLDFVVQRVVELSYTAWDLSGFADDCDMPGPPFRWDIDRRPTLQAELDALFFHLYGLDREETAWVLDSFTVLRKYEERDLDEFRTKRLVLERYDAMAQAILTQGSYETPLDPGPADDAVRLAD